MSNQPITCFKCDHEIERGEQYIAYPRQRERLGRRGAVKVEDAELLAAYHLGCDPEQGRAS